jgi:hypothetical protein
MSYVPNTIRILTHKVDLWHHRLRFGGGGRSPNRQWNCRKVKKGEERKKERRKKEKEGVYPILRKSHADQYSATNT